MPAQSSALRSTGAYALPALAFAWSLFWATDRLPAYFSGTSAENAAGFRAAVLPADADPSVAAGFEKLCVAPMYAKK